MTLLQDQYNLNVWIERKYKYCFYYKYCLEFFIAKNEYNTSKRSHFSKRRYNEAKMSLSFHLLCKLRLFWKDFSTNHYSKVLYDLEICQKTNISTVLLQVLFEKIFKWLYYKTSTKAMLVVLKNIRPGLIIEMWEYSLGDFKILNSLNNFWSFH